jgi:biopolymer transport protein ExbD
MGAASGGDEEELTQINITPFVDIILVVLIIFMVTTSSIVEKAIKVQLPDAATGEGVEDTPLAIVVEPGGVIRFNGEPTDIVGLRGLVRIEKANAVSQGIDVMCMIGADVSVPYGDVTKVVDLVRQEGVAKFALQINDQPMPPEAEGGAGPVAGGPAPGNSP